VPPPRAHHHRITGAAATSSIEDHFDASPFLDISQKHGRSSKPSSSEKLQTCAGKLVTRQTEPLGPGHAVSSKRDLVGDEPLAVLLGEVLIPAENPAQKTLIEVYEATGRRNRT